MFNKRKPYFIQGFNPSASLERLKIPAKFIRSMEEDIFGTASLMGPSGNTWRANLIQQTDGVFLHDGWEAFVKDHSLELGDSLVFRYDGNLHFTIQVFDQSSCEKEDAFSVISSQAPINIDNDIGKKREMGTTTLLESIVEGVPKKMRSVQVHSGCVTTKHETNVEIANKQECIQAEVVSQNERCQEISFSSETVNCNYQLQNSVTVAMPSESIVHGANLETVINNRTKKADELGSHARGCMMVLSASEAQRIARSFTSCFPNFAKVMKRFNISGSYTLNVPYQFSMAHLPKCKVKIVLHNLKGESWTVNSIPTTKVQTSHTFCGGWLAFVRDNNISIGDICIFELVNRYELRVQILRVGMEGLNHQSSMASQKGITKIEISDRKESDPEELIMTKRNHETAFSDSMVKHGFPSKVSTFSSRSTARNGKSVIWKKDSSQDKDKQGSYTKSCMSMKSAPEEKLAAQSFISRFPHFVRIMKKFNISGSYTLKIPYQFSMEHLPKCKTEIVLRNLKGKCWTVNSIPTTKVQTLHTFCGGWMAFVRDNDIQMGDICIFELVGKCEMLAHIAGVGRKGLEYRSCKVGSNELSNNSS